MKSKLFSSAMTSPRHGGAVIIVVISLMTSLVFLGLFFYNWTSQEVANAEFFASSETRTTDINPLPIFDMVSEQVIVGTRDEFRLSALWGGMHSLLAHQIGRIQPDLKPVQTNVRSGLGVVIRNIEPDESGRPLLDNNGLLTGGSQVQLVYVDQNEPTNNRPVGVEEFVIHFSALAQSDRSNDAFSQGAGSIPFYSPNADYTYPDLNSLFLAYDETSPDLRTGDGKYRILIPSFFRPQLFPELRTSSGGDEFLDLYSKEEYRRKVLRPHKLHLYPDSGGAPQHKLQRFLTADATIAESGNTRRILGPFPFPRSSGEANLGIFTNVGHTTDAAAFSLLDVDLDGDGIKDSIWLDLGLPMINLPDGTQWVPLASAKIIDADGLINLNTAGNLVGRLAGVNESAESIQPLSVSNLGMSRSEVNPLWALNAGANTAEITDPEKIGHLVDKYGLNPVDEKMKLANLELKNLLEGWLPVNQADFGRGPYIGRYGDYLNIGGGGVDVPAPGRSGAVADGADDDSDLAGLGVIRRIHRDLQELSPPYPNLGSSVHPLSPVGLGLGLFGSSLGAGYIEQSGERKFSGPEQNPAKWVRYLGFQALADSLYGPDVATATGAELMSNSVPPATILVNEQDETILEPLHANYGLDAPFQPSDNADLHLSGTDRQNSRSRLSTLAAFNFQDASNANEVRKRFTTDSWDRLELNYAPPVMRPSERDSQYGFPPAKDPDLGQEPAFRTELLDLLRTGKLADGTEPVGKFGKDRDAARHRLNLNQLLCEKTGYTVLAPQVNGNPNYRNLVPHPAVITGADSSNIFSGTYPLHHCSGAVPAFDSIRSNVYAQEWWARYDRQRLARDFYTLLWYVGRDDSAAIPSPNQAREMAQFAVNIVDAMDEDGVITEFFYDENLDNGWDRDIANLKVVYGVEHQELAFNEVMFIHTTLVEGEPDNITEFDEEAEDPQFFNSFVELRNAAPWPVALGHSSWRLRRVTSKTGSSTRDFSLVINDSDTSGNIAPGGEYLIGCQGGNDFYPGGGAVPRPSDFRLDLDGNGLCELYIPKYNEPMGVPAKDATGRELFCDLDAFHPNHASKRDGIPITAATTLLNSSNFEEEVFLVLERRLHPRGDGLDESVNPWVEVDRISGRVREFDGKLATLNDPMKEFCSQERSEPFDPGVDLTFASITPPDFFKKSDFTKLQGQHSLPCLSRADQGMEVRGNSQYSGQVSPSGGQLRFKLWQPHFDREFFSPVELLAIPIYGYYSNGQTSEPWDAHAFGGATKNLALGGEELTMPGHRTAAARMLNPQQDESSGHPTRVGMEAVFEITGAAGHYENRWYRFLEFVDVPSQNDLALQKTPLLQRRTPGKINLNTIRHEEVFAGLIDDPIHLRLTEYDNQQPLTLDVQDNNRHWYWEHRVSRDGIDPILNNLGVNLTIPGGLRALPFRSLSFLDEVNAPGVSTSGSPSGTASRSVEQTILRERPLNEPTGQGLFEANFSSALEGLGVDFHTKQRILAKVANNSTTRSNVFFMFLGIDFFEAHQNSIGNVQIGAKATADRSELKPRRMFLVVDMTRLEEAYKENGTFDFRKFIIHRQLLP